MSKQSAINRTDDEIRRILLNYFYERNKNARSARSDKTGVAAKITVVRRDLKASHGLRAQDIWSNLTYLISQGWIEEVQIAKSVPLKTGTIIPQVTSYYKVTAAGIDKHDGPGEFTMDRFRGIRIEATGQNIITVGDGNQVDARHHGLANALAHLRSELITSAIDESKKLSVVADIDTIQIQLAKPEPNHSVIGAIWRGVEAIATSAGLAASVATVSQYVNSLIS